MQLRQQDFAARFLAIADSQVQGLGGLDVEITEGVLLEDPAFLAGTLQTLRDEVEQIKLLQFLGCEQSQGYLHSRPVPAEQFEVLLNIDGRVPDIG